MRGEDVSDILKARAKEKGYSFEEGTSDSKVYKKSSGSVKTTEVTYDDNRELIPLSKRYNESKDTEENDDALKAERAAGTVTEQSFDVFMLNRSFEVYFVDFFSSKWYTVIA